VGPAPSHHRCAGLLAPALSGLLALLVSSCATQQQGPPHPAGGVSSVIARLGAVPIPTAAGTPAPLPASAAHPQLLPIGDALLARLPEGSLTITALGPDVDLPADTHLPIEDADATITIRAQDTIGTIITRPEEFTARDDHGRDIPLTDVTATGRNTWPGATTLPLTGHFHAGSAQITWRHDGSVIGVWAFVIELD
jgi:hypothetical protein